jgi:hypothetical protein
MFEIRLIYAWAKLECILRIHNTRNGSLPIGRLGYEPQVLFDVGLRPQNSDPQTLALRSGITIVYEVQLRRGDC